MELRRKQIICELYHASSSTKSCDIYKRCLATLNVRYLLRATVSPRQRLTKGQPPTQPRWQVYKSVSSNSCATSGHRQMLFTSSADYSVGARAASVVGCVCCCVTGWTACYACLHALLDPSRLLCSAAAWPLLMRLITRDSSQEWGDRPPGRRKDRIGLCKCCCRSRSWGRSSYWRCRNTTDRILHTYNR